MMNSTTIDTINSYSIQYTTLPVFFWAIVILLIIFFGYRWYKDNKEIRQMEKKMTHRYPPNQTNKQYPEPTILSSGENDEFERLVLQSKHVDDSINLNLVAKKSELETEMNEMCVKCDKAKNAYKSFANKYTDLKTQRDQINEKLGIIEE